MCGACASDSSAPTTVARDPKAPPPKSAYYESHMRHQQASSLPSRFLDGAWRFGILVVIFVIPMTYVGILAGRLITRGSLGTQQQQQQQNHPGTGTQQQQLTRRQLGVPLGLNLTRPAEPFWQAYRELLLFEGADVTGRPDESERQLRAWFADVNDDTMLIAEMWSKVEKQPVVVSVAGDGDADHHHRRRGVVEDHSYDHDSAFHGTNKVLGLDAYHRIDAEISARAALLREASLEFGAFLGNRTRALRAFMRKGTVWQQRGDGKTVGGTGLSEADLKQLGPLLLSPGANGTNGTTTTTTRLTPSININIDNRTVLLLEDIATYDNETAVAVARTAEGLVKELVRQHALLLERLEHDGGGLVAHLCRVSLPQARTVENRFIGKLLKAAEDSEAATQWREGKRGLAIGALQDRICELDNKRAEMRKALAWLEGRFQTQTLLGEGADGKDDDDDDDDGGGRRRRRRRYLEMTKVRDDVTGKKRKVPELLVWVQSAVELLGAWSTVLMDVEEGVLIALRKQELEEEKEKNKEKEDEELAAQENTGGNDVEGSNTTAADFDYEKSWSRWKRRNCGATSCYAETTLLTRFKHFFAGKEPLAGDAWDERDRLVGWDVKIWKGIYEKACCVNGTLAKTLKYGEKTPDFPVGGEFAHEEL